jgi:hypothetical protein
VLKTPLLTATLDAFSSEDNDEDDESDDAEASSDDKNELSEDCDCDGLGSFPCWKCVKTDRMKLPN